MRRTKQRGGAHREFRKKTWNTGNTGNDVENKGFPATGRGTGVEREWNKVFTATETVMREGVAMAAVGAVIGTAATLAMGNVLRSALFEVKPADPVTLAAVVVVLAVTTLAASYIPARRALAVDPAVALRHD